jgi:hypothetical protein
VILFNPSRKILNYILKEVTTNSFQVHSNSLLKATLEATHNKQLKFSIFMEVIPLCYDKYGSKYGSNYGSKYGSMVVVFATGPKVRGFDPDRGRWIF